MTTNEEIQNLEAEIESKRADYEMAENAVKNLHNERKIILKTYEKKISAKKLNARNRRKEVIEKTNEHKAKILQLFKAMQPQADLGEIITSYPKKWRVPNCLSGDMKHGLEPKGADYVWSKYGYDENEGISLTELKVVVAKSPTKAKKEEIAMLLERLIHDNLHYQLRGDMKDTLRKLRNYDEIKAVKHAIKDQRELLQGDTPFPQQITVNGYTLTVSEGKVVDRGEEVEVYEAHMTPSEA